MSTWSPEVLQGMRGNLVDAAANLERFREVVLMTINEGGTATVMRRVRPDGSNFEILGILQLVSNDIQKELGECWFSKDTPPFREDP